MRKKAIKFSGFIFAMLLCFIMAGCDNGNTVTVTDEAKTQVVEKFLSEFCTFNKEERYNTFSEAIAEIGIEQNEETSVVAEKQQQAYDEYYKSFASLATQNCIDTMQANRLPFKYDSVVFEKDITVEIGDVEYETTGENSYTFEVSFKSSEANEILKSPIKGQLTLQIADGQVLVDSIRVY